MTWRRPIAMPTIVPAARIITHTGNVEVEVCGCVTVVWLTTVCSPNCGQLMPRKLRLCLLVFGWLGR